MAEPVSAAPALLMRGLTKQFGATKALDEASLDVASGTVHGLVGQNGAGKSTLIKVLAGLVEPEAGTVEFFGRPLEHITPAGISAAGVEFIHQDRLLVPTATVGEALFLGREPRGSGFGRGVERRARESLERFFGLTLPRGALIRDLSTAEQQIVQITRALLADPRLIVFDEPTAALDKGAADNLFTAIRALKARGLTVLYISHYLAEIERICDAVTVMRNGRSVAQVDPKATPISAITRLMVGREVKELFPKTKAEIGEPVLEIEGLGAPNRFRDVSLTLRRGEIVGLTGLVGSGAKDLVRALFGLEPAKDGRISLHGAAPRLADPQAAAGRGIALVPEDRRAQGVALDLSVRENVSLASLARFTRFGWLDETAEHRKVQELAFDLRIKASSIDAPVRTLSGGNQQKVVIAKWLSRASDLYILDEPTVGVDVAAKTEIYRLIGELAARGAAIFMLSADLDELIGITDRILVMYRGAIVAEERAAETSPDRLLDAALSGSALAAGLPHVA